MRKFAMMVCAIFMASLAQSQPINVRGKITDHSGKVVANASVELLLAKQKTTSGIDGAYDITGPSRILGPMGIQSGIISLKSGLLEVRLIRSAPIRVDIFDTKGNLVNHFSVDGTAGVYRFDLVGKIRSERFLFIKASVGDETRYMKYLPLAGSGSRKTTAFSTVATGRLSKALAIKDTIKVVALGFDDTKVLISSYDTTVNVVVKILASTPPMGWSSWNYFWCNDVTDAVVRKEADAMVASGMRDVGYQYINIDDCWEANNRDAQGNLISDPAKFPDMKALADYIHSKGLKFGLYTSANTRDGDGKPGSPGYEVRDAKEFASWGVDYLKQDNNGAYEDPQRQHYRTMDSALKTCGRTIVYSICDPPFNQNFPALGQLWRTTLDISPKQNTVIWDNGNESPLGQNGYTGGSVMTNMDDNECLAKYAGPGQWNDPDMMEVGAPPLTDIENRSHFAMWAIMAAPLIAGNDISNMSAAVKAILTASEVIAVDQDSLGVQGTRVKGTRGQLEVWSKKLSGTNTFAVACLNRTGSAADIQFTWSDVGLPSGSATVRDLYAKMDFGTFTDSYTAKAVPSHGVAMLKVKLQ